MGLIFSVGAISKMLRDSVVSSGMHTKVTVNKIDGENTYVYSENDDGANRHEIFEASILADESNFALTAIVITLFGKTTINDIRTITKWFFEENGECSIKIV